MVSRGEDFFIVGTNRSCNRFALSPELEICFATTWQAGSSRQECPGARCKVLLECQGDLPPAEPITNITILYAAKPWGRAPWQCELNFTSDGSDAFLFPRATLSRSASMRNCKPTSQSNRNAIRTDLKYPCCQNLSSSER